MGKSIFIDGNFRADELNLMGRIEDRDIERVLGFNKKIRDWYSRYGLLDHHLTMCTGDYVQRCLGHYSEPDRFLSSLFNYIYHYCMRGGRGIRPTLMKIVQVDDKILLEMYFMEYPKVSLVFKDNGECIKVNRIKLSKYEVADIEKLLLRVLDSILIGLNIPVHSIECWVRNPLNFQEKIKDTDRCLIGFSSSLVCDSEYDISYLIG